MVHIHEIDVKLAVSNEEQYSTNVHQNPPMLYRREELQMQTTNCPASFQAGLRSPLDPKK
jgi:hypothetical protein